MSEVSSRITPIDDSYPSCDITYATLGIYNIDPNLVTNKLSLSPTMSQKTGVPRIMPSGVERVGRINSWLLSSEKYVLSKDLRRHLDWLLDKIEPVSEQLIGLQQLPNTKMRIHCVWWSTDGGGGPTLWPEQMGRIAKLNLECDFSFAYYEKDEK